MRTRKVLKITSVLNGIFCLLCVASTVCFAISDYLYAHHMASWDIFLNIAGVLALGWAVNPAAPISFVIGMIIFCMEYRQPENRPLIGKKWIWILVWPVITTIFYFAALIFAMAFTGGV